MDSLEPKKLALIRVLQILRKYSDYNHPMLQEDIAEKLDQDFGITLERKGQPIKFCVNNNPSSNNGIADCGAIRLSDLPRVNFSFLSVECYARLA